MTPFAHIPIEERETFVLAMLAEIHDRKLAGELVARICACMSSVTQNGGPGEVTVKFIVKPMGEGRVMVDAKFGGKTPAPVQRAAMFYVNENGEPMREDPRQGRLDIDDEPAGPRALSTDKPRRAAAGE